MTAVVESGPAAGYRWRWRVLVVVLTAEAMDILDTTTVNVMGPSVRRSIGGGLGLVQWLSAAYSLAFVDSRFSYRRGAIFHESSYRSHRSNESQLQRPAAGGGPVYFDFRRS